MKAIAFETSLQDTRITEESETTPTGAEHVNQALKAVINYRFVYTGTVNHKIDDYIN
jgi:hypothetical protein